jgi:hypothetical protein
MKSAAAARRQALLTIMTDIVDRYRVRVAAAALAVAGILFVLYPATRPYTNEKSLQGAQAFSSTAWLTSHAMGMLGFIGLVLYLPQFFLPPPVRVAHGLLLAAGCLWLAIGLWGRRQRVAADSGQRTTVGAVVTD